MNTQTKPVSKDVGTPVDEHYCEDCTQPCSGINVDFGIGPYEYWGKKGCDINFQYVSDCCESTVLCNGEAQEFEPEY